MFPDIVAQDRIEANGWSNISLVQADAAEFGFPTQVDAILSTYALTQVPECAEVIAHGAAALFAGGRWVVLDLKVPGNTPGWLAQLGTATVRPFASIDEWIMRRPWEAIRAAMQEELAALEKALHTPQRPVAAIVGGAKVSIDAHVNPDILGGLVVKVGSRLFDSSIRSKLARLQLAMKGVA